jgi:hypothetical protein
MGNQVGKQENAQGSALHAANCTPALQSMAAGAADQDSPGSSLAVRAREGSAFPFGLGKRSTLTAFQPLLPRSRGTTHALLSLVGAVSKQKDQTALTGGWPCTSLAQASTSTSTRTARAINLYRAGSPAKRGRCAECETAQRPSVRRACPWRG